LYLVAVWAIAVLFLDLLGIKASGRDIFTATAGALVGIGKIIKRTACVHFPQAAYCARERDMTGKV
jgi:hypothetical protein